MDLIGITVGFIKAYHEREERWLSSVLVPVLRVYSNVPKKFVPVDFFRRPQTGSRMRDRNGMDSMSISRN